MIKVPNVVKHLVELNVNERANICCSVSAVCHCNPEAGLGSLQMYAIKKTNKQTKKIKGISILGDNLEVLNLFLQEYSLLTNRAIRKVTQRFHKMEYLISNAGQASFDA